MLGYYQPTGVIESARQRQPDRHRTARRARSPQHGRLTDSDEEAAMERKKREGFF
jgi:sulfate adenylyltransferase subunit 2